MALYYGVCGHGADFLMIKEIDWLSSPSIFFRIGDGKNTLSHAVRKPQTNTLLFLRILRRRVVAFALRMIIKHIS